MGPEPMKKTAPAGPRSDDHTHTTTVRVTVMTLRKKLGEPGIIETVVGSGYRVPNAGLASS